MNSPRLRAWLRMLAVCGLVVGVDQTAKGIVINSLAPGERVDFLPGIDLTRISNSGIAFGLLDQGGDAVVFAITAGALSAVAVWFALDPTRPGLWLAVGALAGGALGNLADRVRADAVTDFIDPILWPTFNIADVAITVGVVLLVSAAMAPAAPNPPR